MRFDNHLQRFAIWCVLLSMAGSVLALEQADAIKELEPKEVVTRHADGSVASRGLTKQNPKGGLPLKIGKWEEWHENGVKSAESTYDDEGKLHGPFKTWHKNGMKRSEGSYERNIVVNTTFEWREDGVLTDEMTFEKGERAKWVRYRTGETIVEVGIFDFNHGELGTGTRETFDKNKNIISKIELKDGQPIMNDSKAIDSKNTSQSTSKHKDGDSRPPCSER